MVDHEPWSVAKVDHGRTPRLYHSQPWSTIVDNEKPWYHGQTVAGAMSKQRHNIQPRPASVFCLRTQRPWDPHHSVIGNTVPKALQNPLFRIV